MKYKPLQLITLILLLFDLQTGAAQPATPPSPPSYSLLAVQFSGLVNRFSDVASLRENTLIGERARHLKHIARTQATYAELLNRVDRLKFLLKENPSSGVQLEMDGLHALIVRDVREDKAQVIGLVSQITQDTLRSYTEELGATLETLEARLLMDEVNRLTKP